MRSATTPIVSVRPLAIPSAGRGTDLQVRVTAPVAGSDLPVVVLSHGFGGSMDSYDPLVEVWAAAGLVVVQPTHLDSRTLAITPKDPRYDRATKRAPHGHLASGNHRAVEKVA
jgi:predicted dienelactone hydrolase